MKENHLPQRLFMFLAGIFAMSVGVALSCKAGLGTSPISSVPWVVSMFTPWTMGKLTIGLNLLLIIAQPILLGIGPNCVVELFHLVWSGCYAWCGEAVPLVWSSCSYSVVLRG